MVATVSTTPAAAIARAYLVSNFGWTITDGGTDMINSFIADVHCFVVAHNNVDDYRICELGAGNELSSLLHTLSNLQHTS